MRWLASPGRPGPLGSDRSGATAVEFGLVGGLVITLLMGIVELSLIFVANMQVSNAAITVARQIRVGSLQAPGLAVQSSSGGSLSLPDFKKKLCSYIAIVPSSSCVQQIQVDVRVQQLWTGQTAPNPLTGTVFNSNALCYYSGGPGSLVEMRIFYLWPLFEPVLLRPLVTVTSYGSTGNSTSGQWIMLVSNETFRNETNPNVSNTGNGC